MPISFEELWNKCEQLHQESAKNEITTDNLEELILKINLYKAIDQKTEIPDEEKQKIKSRTMGEILLSLTKLSFKDNINVYEALSIALQYRSMGYVLAK